MQLAIPYLPKSIDKNSFKTKLWNNLHFAEHAFVAQK